MSIWGKLVGAAAGLTLGGPIGALIGAIAGHYAVDRGRGAPRIGEGGARAEAERQVAFTIGVIALGAKMAKADGHVSRDEVEAFREVFLVPPGELENVARVFNLAKQDVAGYEAYAGQLAQLFGPGSEILEDVLDGLFHIAKADGAVHPNEMAFLEHVARRFGFAGADFDRIAARHVAPDEGDPYVVLGVSRRAGDDEVKQVYRRLVRENHPDRMIARGVPEEFVAIANERLARINEAYDRILAERAPLSGPPARWRPSPNHEPRAAGPVDILLIHYTAMDSAEGACRWLCDPASKVSAHYLVDEAGRVTQMVAEDRRAWHAGLARWAGESDINSRSIGIEVHNGGPQSAAPEFPGAQIEALIGLARGILARHPIPPARVLAHSDVSPGRKIDPGPHFPWGALAAAGVGIWPLPAPPGGDAGLGPGDAGPAIAELQRDLAAFGYDIESTGAYDARTETVVSAFQLHFRPALVNGRADRSTLAALAAVLAAAGLAAVAAKEGRGTAGGGAV